MRNLSRLDHVCEIIMGQAPSGEAYNSDGKGWPLIAGAGDFGDIYPAAKKFTSVASKLSQPGDIILGIRASIGEKVLSDSVYCLGRGVAGLRAKPALESRYLWHWLTQINPYLASKAKGATFKQVNREDISELEIVLPSLHEQQRIAAILDKADEIKTKRRTALAKLDSLSQAIFLEMFGDPVVNPKGWSLLTLNKISEFENGDRSSNYPSGEDIKDHGILFLSTKNIVNDSLNLNYTVYITKEKFDSLSRGKAKLNDIIITLRGTLGSCCIFSLNDTAFINAQMMIIRPGMPVSPIFLHAVLTSKQYKEQFSRIGSGVAVPQLTAKQLSELKTPLPPLSLQQEFARRIAAVEKLKTAHRAALAELDALFASLQHRAFRGEL